MAVTSTIKTQVDLPVWEWMRFAPIVTAAGLCTCCDEAVGGSYIYYLASTTAFYRYSTITDSWQQLQGPPIATLTASSMRYSTYGGYRGRVISATNTTAVIPSLGGNNFIGKTIRITEGTGVGQERVISAVTNPEVLEFGTVTTFTNTATLQSIQDLQTIPKKWTINQWRGHTCRIVFGPGFSQERKIIHNDANTLYFYDANLQGHEHWNNTGFSAIAPYVVPVANTSHYFIEKCTVTVPTWTTTPDATSKFMVKTGAIWLVTGRTLANGAIAMQYYDIASDTWLTKTCPGGLVGYLLTGDVSIERCGEIGGVFDSGDCDASGTRTMVDATKTWTTDQWVGFMVLVTKTSTEVTQRSTIIGNTANTLYIDDTAWSDTPSTSHTYTIEGNRNNVWLSGNNYATLYKYLVEQDLWTDSWHYDNGIAANMSLRYGSQLPYGYTAAVNTAAILTVHASPTSGGTSGYKIGDICSINEATGGKVRVTGINASGQVTSLELYACGTAGTYTVATGKATTNVFPASGGGSGLTVNVLTVGSVARFTTAVSHNLRVNDVVTTAGATVGAWNTNFTVLACDSITAFDAIPPNNTAPAAAFSNSATLVVDAAKAWTIDEHKGKLIAITTFGLVPTCQTMKITSNTASTITVPTITQAVTGTSRYLIKDQCCFGADFQDKIPARNNTGWAIAAGSSSTVLATSDRTWVPNQWVGYKLRVLCGTGYDKGEVAITANDATTLTSAGWGFTPDATTKYEIEDSYGICTSTYGTTTTLIDASKAWGVNQWYGKMVRINSGVGQTVEVAITTNTATVLTCGTITQPTATTTYCILGAPVRGIGHQIMWNYGQTGVEKGCYLYIPRGGTSVTAGPNVIDRYCLHTNRWDYSIFMNPDTEIHTLGTQWCYDNKDRIYFCPTGAQGSRIFYLDLNTRMVIPSGQTPYAHGAAVQGNKFDIIETVDGLKFLYVMRQTGSEYWRTLIFW